MCVCVQVVPVQGALEVAGKYMNDVISPHSFTCFDLLLTEEDMDDDDDELRRIVKETDSITTQSEQRIENSVLFNDE